LKRLQSSEPLHTTLNPTSCLYRILSSCWLVNFYLMKKSAKVLHYFGLDCGMLEFFKYSTYEPESKEQLLTLPRFCSTVWWKRSRFVHIQTVIRKSRRFDSLLCEAAQNFEVFSNIQNQKLKIKNL
jgi:hypothetical protein